VQPGLGHSATSGMSSLPRGDIGGRFYYRINLKKVIVMGIFRKQPECQPRYSLDYLRRDIGEAMEKTRAARIHPIEIERAVHAVADWQAQYHSLNSAII
jgi:hypothetical protein